MLALVTYPHFQQTESQADRINTMDEILTNVTEELAQQQEFNEEQRQTNIRSMKVNKSPISYQKPHEVCCSSTGDAHEHVPTFLGS